MGLKPTARITKLEIHALKNKTIVKDLDKVIDLIQSYDLVSYSDAAAWIPTSSSI